MERSLIRKNQLHPDIADLISGYGSNFFTNPDEVNESILQEIQNTVLITGNQNIDGIKNFTSRPTVNGTGVLLIGEAAAGGGNGGSEYVFPSDLEVSLPPGKTFGRYQNGDTIEAAGKTTSQVIRLAIEEPLNPTVNLDSPTTSLPYGSTNISNVLNFSYVINSFSANSVASSVSLEWKRANEVNWTVLSTDVNSTTFTHTTTNTFNNANAFNYRYIVTDSEGASDTKTFNISISAYLAPSLSNISIGTAQALRGDTNTNISATIVRNSPLIQLNSYQLQFQTTTNNVASSWQNIGSQITINGNPSSFNIPSTAFDGSANKNVDKIAYRVLVNDGNGQSTLSMGERNFLYAIYIGYSTALSLSSVTDIEQLTSVSLELSNGKARTVNNVSPTSNQFTYYCYWFGAGDLQGITDGLESFLTAFTKQSDLQGENVNQATVRYRVYKSNAPGAFGGITLTFN